MFILFIVFNCFLVGATKETTELPLDLKTEHQQFIDKHWQQPIIISSSLKDHELAPETCGKCHKSQYDDWSTSLHSKAMGAGVIGQIKQYDLAELQKQKCLTCHAPLLRQSVLFANKEKSNSAHSLDQQGVICAACHIRDKTWYGPLPINNSLSETPPLKSLHPKKSKKLAFESATFCVSCHQFESTGNKLEGKLLQNTYSEWLDSQFSVANVTCQNCHMPARKHLWQGIHSKEMVLKGLSINTRLVSSPPDHLSAIMTVENTGVGHYFPTYITPRVLLKAYQVNSDEEIIEDSVLEFEVMRSVSLDLSIEFFDTRIKPGEKEIFTYQNSIFKNAKKLVFNIIVEPDYFYRNAFKTMLSQPSNATNNAHQYNMKDLRFALKKTETSSYLLYSKQFNLL